MTHYINRKLKLSQKWFGIICLHTVCVYLRNGLVDIHPACQWVDPEVLRLFAGHGVRDGCIGAKVVVMSCHPQETSPDHCILTKEVYGRRNSVLYVSVVVGTHNV